MGQKVNPVALRTGVMEGWKSSWYSPKKGFAALLVEDAKIREFIKKHKEEKDNNKGVLSFPGVAKIQIERTRDEVRVILFRQLVSRPRVRRLVSIRRLRTRRSFVVVAAVAMAS